MSGERASLRKHWFVACTTSDLRERVVGRMVLGVPIVLFRSGGVAVALVDRCPHRNAPLSAGRQVGDLLRCPYHGWSFDGEGQCRRIPGLSGDVASPVHRAQTVRVAERDGLVWVHLGEDAQPPPSLPPAHYPALDDSAFDSFIWVSDVQCALVDGLENLLDGMHPHFVHARLVRQAHRRRAVRVTVRRTAEMAEATYAENSAPSGLIPKLLEGMRTSSIGRFFPPATAQLEYRGPRGPRFVLTAMFTPCDEQRVTVHAVVSTPAQRIPAPVKQALVRLVFGPVLKQDRDILRRQQANIARFGQPAFTSTPLDIMRPHILYFLREADSTDGEPATPYERTVIVEL